jgi:hypothetical protein
MAKTDSLTNEQREVMRAQNDALLLWPEDRAERLKEWDNLTLTRARMNDKIAQVKKEVGLSDLEKTMIDTRGVVPQTMKIMAMLTKMPAGPRSACCRQVMKLIDDRNFVIADLLDEGAIGKSRSDLEGGAVFDRTSEGKRRGGATAQPRTTDQMAQSNVVHLPPHNPTDPVPLDVALKRLEEYRAANKPKAGAKPKVLRELEASVEAARAREAAVDPLADKPEAEPGQVTAGLREGAAESEQHIRDAVAGGPAAPPPPAAAPVDKPKRTRAKKVDAAPPPQEEPDAEVEDDTVDVGDAPAPPRPDAIGAAPSSYQAG